MTTRATPRPARGTAAKLRRARARLHKTQERAAKAAARDRDGCCRRCYSRRLLESAHLRNKQMGGDHGLRSGTAADYVTLCATCHRGPRSIHSGHLRMVFGPEGGNGLMVFERVASPGVSNLPRGKTDTLTLKGG